MTTTHVLLKKALETYDERHLVYGDNYLTIGNVFNNLFPEGLSVCGQAGWNRLHALMLMVVKLTRYAQNFDAGGHQDLLLDLIVYTAMLGEIDDEDRVHRDALQGPAGKGDEGIQEGTGPDHASNIEKWRMSHGLPPGRDADFGRTSRSSMMIATVFDTETTDLSENRSMAIDLQPEIIEFYACRADLDTGDVLDEIHYMIKPRRPIAEKITKITHISNEDVADSPHFIEVLPSIAHFIEQAPTIIAHNLAFDMEVVEIEFGRHDMPIVWPRDRICTVEQTMHLMGYRLSLTALHELLFGEKFPEAHRANKDTAALLRVACKLREMGEI